MRAQTLSPVVISSSGGFFTAAGNSLSFTVAEMTMVQTFIQPTNLLTQGFQQPEQITTAIIENDKLLDDVMVYPNPSNGQFSIKYNANNNDINQVRIYNIVGQIVFYQNYDVSIGLNTITIDIGKFGQGIYTLELSSTSLKGKQKISIHKINLVY
jgi:hypothetical protein